MATETVLVVGSSGNVGVSVIIGALRSNLNVLAIVRNKSAQEKVLQHVDKSLPTNRITFAEADVTDENAIAGIVDQVKAGKLPAFQHVYSTVGIMEPKTPVYTVDIPTFRRTMNIGFESNFFAYRATIPYLLDQGNPNTTWTLVTGGAGTMGVWGATAMTQGALFSMANVACRENEGNNIRFNEVYLTTRVEYDSDVDKEPVSTWGYKKMKCSEFARVYEGILKDKKIEACRVNVHGFDDLDALKYEKKLPAATAKIQGSDKM